MFMITTKSCTYRCNDIDTGADIILGETGDERDYERMKYIMGNMAQIDCKNCICMLVCKEAQDSKFREQLREGKATCCDFYPKPDDSIKKAITAVDKMNSTFDIPQSVYVVEECSELTKELMKEQRKKGNDFSIIDEACDVLTAVFVLLHHYGISEQDVKQRILVKCNRALERYEKSGEM